jgi:hypothetical protein
LLLFIWNCYILHEGWLFFRKRGTEPTSALRDVHKFLFKTQNLAAGRIWLICIAAETPPFNHWLYGKGKKHTTPMLSLQEGLTHMRQKWWSKHMSICILETNRADRFTIKLMYLGLLNDHTIYLQFFLWKMKVLLKTKIFMLFLILSIQISLIYMVSHPSSSNLYLPCSVAIFWQLVTWLWS